MSNNKPSEIDNNSENISAILSEIKAIREENSYYKTVCAQLVEKTNYLEKEVNSLKGELNYMRQDKLRDNLIIQSIPKLSSENLGKVVPAIVKALKIECNPTEYTVNQIVTKKKTYLLLVKFRIFGLKQKFMNAIKVNGLTTDQIGISGQSRKIFFTNHLTFYNLNLLHESQILKKDHQFEFVWFQGGVVLARLKKDFPIHRIKTLDDINKIIEKAVSTTSTHHRQPQIQSRNHTATGSVAGGSKD